MMAPKAIMPEAGYGRRVGERGGRDQGHVHGTNLSVTQIRGCAVHESERVGSAEGGSTAGPLAQEAHTVSAVGTVDSAG